MEENKEFNFREFILKEEIAEDIESESKKTTRKKPEVEFNVEWSDHCDAIISRKTKQSTQYLALIVSQKQYYVKDNKGKITPLTIDTLNKFMTGADDSGIVINTNWMTVLPKNKKNNANLLNILNTDLFCELAKMGYAWLSEGLIQQKEDWRNRRASEQSIERTGQILKENRNLFKKLVELGKQTEPQNETMFKQEMTKAFFSETGNSFGIFFGDAYGMILMQMLRNSGEIGTYPAFLYLKNIYGESGVSQLAEALVAQRGVSTRKLEYSNNSYRFRNLKEEAPRNLAKIAKGFNCKFENFLEYIVYEPQRQGYSIEDFIQSWYDTLKMQAVVYGEVKDKYPEELASLHQRMSYRCALLEYAKSIEEEQKRNQQMSYREKELQVNCYENTSDPWIITVPENVGAILEEAQQQSNCLASYVEPYVKGDTDLYFMRDKKAPEASLITIEIRDNVLRQAYAHHNTKPSEKEMKFIEKWCEAKGFEFTQEYSPRCA